MVIIENTANLSQNDDSWIEEEVYLYDNAVLVNSYVKGNDIHIFENALLINTEIDTQDIKIYGNSKIIDTYINYRIDIFENSYINDNNGVIIIQDNNCVLYFIKQFNGKYKVGQNGREKLCKLSTYKRQLEEELNLYLIGNYGNKEELIKYVKFQLKKLKLLK